MVTRSVVRGKPTSDVEVLNVSAFGIWLLARGKEYFAPYKEFPWFKDATIGDILGVEMPHEGHLYWPKLDVDLAIASLEAPEKFPLMAKKGKAKGLRRS